MGWIEIMPEFRTLFRERGWTSAEEVLRVPGVLVNRHRDRVVEQISIAGNGEQSYFIKKDRRVRWRDRFRNAWHGFGWCANAVREAAMMQALTRHGIGCPQVVALGETSREAFVVTCDESDKVDLRVWLRDNNDLKLRSDRADSLGASLAKMHDAGFAHPDLFAKHILVSSSASSNPICILDWQRARYCPRLTWHARRRDLALLDATLHETLASDRLRLRFLSAYLEATSDHANCPPISRLAKQLRQESDRLRGRRQIREVRQPAIGSRDQQFVPLRQGRLLVVRSYYDEKQGKVPKWLLDWPESGPDVPRNLSDETHRVWIEKVFAENCTDWYLPKLAHTLFSLQRFHVPGLRLLAAARSAEHVLLLTRSPRTILLQQAMQSATISRSAELFGQAEALIDRIHEAGFGMDTPDSWSSMFGVDSETGQVTLARPDRLVRNFTPWRGSAKAQATMQG